MKTEIILNNVLPEESILFKLSHGLYDFYLNYKDYEDGISFSRQRSDESFSLFIDRVVEELIIKEKEEEDKPVTVDYAIYIGNNKKNLKRYPNF